MLTYFNCPSGDKILIKDCLNKCTRPEGRCLSLPTLYEIGKVREWKGRASTTQLLKGVRQAYLEIIKPYAIDPLDSAFMLLGTRHHQKLEYTAKALEMIAEKQLNSEITGILDLLEPDSLESDKYILYDYKTSGSYAVARALGRKNDAGEPDMREWELQLNKGKYTLVTSIISSYDIFSRLTSGTSIGSFVTSRFTNQCCCSPLPSNPPYSLRELGNGRLPASFIILPVFPLYSSSIFTILTLSPILNSSIISPPSFTNLVALHPLFVSKFLCVLIKRTISINVSIVITSSPVKIRPNGKVLQAFSNSLATHSSGSVKKLSTLPFSLTQSQISLLCSSVILFPSYIAYKKILFDILYYLLYSLTNHTGRRILWEINPYGYGYSWILLVFPQLSLLLLECQP